MKAGITLAMVTILIGCGARLPIGESPNIVFVIPGVSGDSGRYNGLVRALSQSGDVSIEVVAWGAPAVLFFMNFSDKSIHDRAELELAKRIDDWHSANPVARIDLIGHSAGCGVILGALPLIRPSVRIDDVVLLAPSVSPSYDLRPALERVEGTMHVFVSDRDTLFLKWRTGNFGTYDRIRTPAAGNLGFDLTSLPEAYRAKLVQQRYDPRWKSLGNDGGHFGTLSQAFVQEVLIPRLRTSQSSAANSR